MDLISSDEEYDPQPEHRQHTQIFAHSGQHEPTGTKISTKVNHQSTMIMFPFPSLFHQFLTVSKSLVFYMQIRQLTSIKTLLRRFFPEINCATWLSLPGAANNFLIHAAIDSQIYMYS